MRLLFATKSSREAAVPCPPDHDRFNGRETLRFAAPPEKEHRRKPGDGEAGDGSNRPNLAVYGGIEATDNASQSNQESKYLSYDALSKDKFVDALDFCAPMFFSRYYLNLVSKT
jgi:hypothetical protein